METLNLIMKVTQNCGTEFELKLNGVNANISLSTAVGTCVQRLTDYIRLYKRNNAKLVKCTEDVFISVSVETDGDVIEWISKSVQQGFKFKYRPSASEKGAKRLSMRIYDAVTFSNTPFTVVEHDKVS